MKDGNDKAVAKGIEALNAALHGDLPTKEILVRQICAAFIRVKAAQLSYSDIYSQTTTDSILAAKVFADIAADLEGKE